MDEIDFELCNHLRNLGCSVGSIAWPSICNLFTDLMNREQWLQFFDNLVTYPEYPELFYLFFLGVLIEERESLMSINEYDRMAHFIETFKVRNLGASLKQAIEILGKLQQIEKLIKTGDKPESEVPKLEFRTELPLRENSYQPYMFIPRELI